MDTDWDLCIEDALVEGDLNGGRIFRGDGEGRRYPKLDMSRQNM
jgi:hypothetical protein